MSTHNALNMCIQAAHVAMLGAPRAAEAERAAMKTQSQSVTVSSLFLIMHTLLRSEPILFSFRRQVSANELHTLFVLRVNTCRFSEHTDSDNNAKCLFQYSSTPSEYLMS